MFDSMPGRMLVTSIAARSLDHPLLAPVLPQQPLREERIVAAIGTA
jgi:hypothetical protein